MTITEEDIFELDESYIGERVYHSDIKKLVLENIINNNFDTLTEISKDENGKQWYHTSSSVSWRYAYPVNGPHEKDKKAKSSILIGQSNYSKTVVHCKTQEEYWKLMQYIESLGGTWCNKDLPTSKEYWNKYREETCIKISYKKYLEYSPKDWYLQEGYTIISLQDYLKNNDSTEVKKDGKTFMSKIKNFIKTSLLSSSEKLLRKHGFKTECGEYTQEAKDFAINELCKANEDKMVVIATEMEAEEASK